MCPGLVINEECQLMLRIFGHRERNLHGQPELELGAIFPGMPLAIAFPNLE